MVSPAKNVVGPGVEISPAAIAHRCAGEWAGVRMDAIEIIRREPFEYRFQGPQHLLIMSEQAARLDGETIIEGLPKSTLREFSRKLSLVPAGCEFRGWQKPLASTRVNYFYIDPSSAVIEEHWPVPTTDLRPRLFSFDSDLWSTAEKLKIQAERAGSTQRCYGEALCHVLLHEVFRFNDRAGTGAAKVMRGGLAGWQQNRVRDYIETHLTESLSIEELAGLVHLSPFHFSRAFKQSLGLPPHRFITARRMERAKERLREREPSVTKIGFDLGFSDTSSFTAAFRRETGLSPTEFRRALD